ncbi:MAG TPA: hypothetical protein VK914_09710 [bacterium]|jgi:hypothetical protein|nr:hypothetical protein [bacterium]
MTPPGEPLTIGKGNERFKKALADYGQNGFVGLENQIESAIVNQIPGETELLWEKKGKGQVSRGYISTVESCNESGKTAVFSVHFVACNDMRSPTLLTFGSIDEKEKAALAELFGGQRINGGRP